MVFSKLTNVLHDSFTLQDTVGNANRFKTFLQGRNLAFTKNKIHIILKINKFISFWTFYRHPKSCPWRLFLTIDFHSSVQNEVLFIYKMSFPFQKNFTLQSKRISSFHAHYARIYILEEKYLSFKRSTSYLSIKLIFLL